MRTHTHTKPDLPTQSQKRARPKRASTINTHRIPKPRHPRSLTEQMTAHRAKPELRLDLQEPFAGLRTCMFQLPRAFLPSPIQQYFFRVDALPFRTCRVDYTNKSARRRLRQEKREESRHRLPIPPSSNTLATASAAYLTDSDRVIPNFRQHIFRTSNS